MLKWTKSVGGPYVLPPAPPAQRAVQRATIIPSEAGARKGFPVATGVLDYFPDAIAILAQVSAAGGRQHNPGKPLFWDRSKSADEADTLMRHFLQRGTQDTDGIPHTAKVAWRALAMLQKEYESERNANASIRT